MIQRLQKLVGRVGHWFSGRSVRAGAVWGFGSLILIAAGATALAAEAAEEGAVGSDAGAAGTNVAWGMILEENTMATWITLLVLIFVGLAAGKLLAMVFHHLSKRSFTGRLAAAGLALEHARKPVQLLAFGIFMQIGLAQVAMSEGLADFCSDVATLLIYIAVFWFAFNVVGLVDRVLKKMADRTDSNLDDMLVPLVRKTLRIFVLVLAVLLIADNVFGQDIGAWLAGLGIAGLAVSLAAQDSLRNLFGSVTIVFDRPFKVGDRVAYAGYDGPVEEINFRSTKIRTLTGHLVTVPNSRIVNDPVENIGARPYIRRFMNVTITYDTPKEKINEAVQIIRDILEEPGIADPIHGSVGEDEYPPRVFFNDFNSTSLNIVVIYWHIPPDYWGYLEHAQTFNLRLFEEFEKAGIEFAFPTQTLYLAGDPNRELVVNAGQPGQE